MKFTQAQLEKAFAELLGNENFPHRLGETISRATDEVLIEEDLQKLTKYLTRQKTLRKTECNEPTQQSHTFASRYKPTMQTADTYRHDKRTTV